MDARVKSAHDEFNIDDWLNNDSAEPRGLIEQ
jgi:hypothetical protein